MKAQEANNYLCVLDTPWMERGTIVESTDLEVNYKEYPQIFTMIYKIGERSVVSNDIVYRVIYNNFEWQVKAVKFNERHFLKQTEIFPDIKSAERYKNELENKVINQLREPDLRRYLETIKTISSMSFDGMTYEETRHSFTIIKESVVKLIDHLDL